MEVQLQLPDFLLRAVAFFGVFALLAGAEAAWPRRGAPERLRRWPGNLGLAVVSALLLRLLAPAAGVAAALLAEERGWGLLNLAPVPGWIAFVTTLVLLDLAVWTQHLVTHRVGWLWRLHRVHHTDTAFDLTTGLRFHPLEIALSLLWKAAVIVALGAPVAAVLAFEILLNAAAMFVHADLRLPSALERTLRRVLVTPDMHRVHHSSIRSETDSNFGTLLSAWDRLFHTYRAQPAEGHQAMRIGLDEFRAPAERRLDRLLTLPFRKA
ncbi:MAG TPA: sterol desaturase family protein [Caulobacteraceae bacterium]|nr:sterol desaturase family protein [Caulobacteraceae bacterium]